MHVKILRSIFKELSTNHKLNRIKNSREEKNSSKVTQKIAKNKVHKPYLNKLFYVNLSMLHHAIQNSKDSNLDIESVKNAVVLALYENLHLFGNGGKNSKAGVSKKRSNLVSSS